MKKLFCLILSLVCALNICGCRRENQNFKTPAPASSPEKLVGVWVTYYELPFQGKSETEFSQYISHMFENIKGLGANTVFCHVRPYCDALFPSDIFPWSNAQDRDIPQGTDPGYDPLDIMLCTAHSLGLRFHAWINPYRVATVIKKGTAPYEALGEDHPVRLWMTDNDSENDRWAVVYQTDSGQNISLNPAALGATRLILRGVQEIIEKYPVDGIHFDDYFYPTAVESFDKSVYEEYTAKGGKLPLDQWRRANVNAMVSSVYSLCRSHGVLFGISPAANISEDRTDRNYTELFADIRLWASREGYVDYLIPQLYFGYDYPLEEFQFDNLLAAWCAVPKHGGLKLYIGIGAYKIGTTDAESDEWQKKDDIIAKQMGDALKNSDGGVIFSYSSLFDSADKNIIQRKKLKTVLGRDTT